VRVGAGLVELPLPGEQRQCNETKGRKPAPLSVSVRFYSFSSRCQAGASDSL